MTRGKRSSTSVRSKKANTSTSIKSSEPNLFTIPGELRNAIYRYVLVEDEQDEIQIDDSNHVQPALLRTNAQIREEASKIYYEENRFVVKICDLKLAPQLEHWVWRRTKRPQPDMLYDGNRSWKNFKEWLRMYWRKLDVTAVDPVAEYYDGNIVIYQQAFYLVDAMSRSSWKTVDKALEAFKTAVDAREPFWH